MHYSTLLRAVVAAGILPLLMGSEGGCSDPPILNNNGFDLWCGGSLCYWTVEEGDVAPVPTWHADDRGVELIGESATISQLGDTSERFKCVSFRLLADIDPQTRVRLEIDVHDDGTPDWQQTLPVARWSPFEYLLWVPSESDTDAVRFRITKRGPGYAALAQVAVDRASGCTNLPADTGPNELPYKRAPLARSRPKHSGLAQ